MRAVDRSHYPTRLRKLHDPEDEREILALTPGERMAMVSALTKQAWAFKEGTFDGQRLRRDVVRVVRGRG